MAIRSLILAIEPDPRQASHLAAAARRISVELLVVDSVAQALTALEGRLPDLILTPTFLPCRDDTVLTERLREAGDAATHIQRLTTPLFEREAPRPGRVRSALRKRTPAKGPISCTAETFADQLAVYLECAAATHRKPRHAQRSVPVSAASVPEPKALPPPGDSSLMLHPLPADDALSLPPVSLAVAALSARSVNVERPVSVTEDLPAPPETASSVEAVMPVLGAASIGEALVPTPPSVLTEAASSVETRMPVLGDNSVGETFVPMPPVVLPLLPDLPPIRAVIETDESGLAGLAEPLVSCEHSAVEPPPLTITPAPDDAGGTSPAPRRSAPEAPNGRKRRKIMRRMRANDWTA